MTERDLSSLVDLGLTLLQARVYLALLRLGTSRASQVCFEVGIVRPEAYRILRELSSKGLVQRNLSSPSTYAAAPPSEALSLLVQQVKDRVAILDQKKDDLVRSLSTLAPESEDISNQPLSVITGGGNLILKVCQMVAHAKEDYAGIWSKYGLRGLDTPIVSAMMSAGKRRVRIRVIAEIDASNFKLANYLSRYVEMRRSRELLIYMDIVDQSEMVFGPAFPASEEEARNLKQRELDLWTSNNRFVKGMYTMFEKLWQVCPKYVPRGR